LDAGRECRKRERHSRLAARVGCEARPSLKRGIGGEHDGDPESTEFFHMAGVGGASHGGIRA